MNNKNEIGKTTPVSAHLCLELAFLIINVVLLSTAQLACAECENSLKLEGILKVDSCASEKGCIEAEKAVYDYSVSAKDEPGVVSISMQASPWHLYDGEWRILTIEELAEMIKPLLRSDIKRILLIASWTGVSPDSNDKSLAQKLSAALDGFPVTGMDGFVWLSKDGTVRTTHQAFTIKHIKSPYGVHPGEEVMVSVVAGWPIGFEEDYFKEGNAYGIMRVGAAWDIFMLCPEKALQSFEAAAKLSNPIAAYNAALIHLEHGKAGDLKAAERLFTQATALGDKKAKARLEKLTHKADEDHAQQNAQPDSR